MSKRVTTCLPLLMLLLAGVASAHPLRELYPPLHCLAGSDPPKTTRVVRLQFGAFDRLPNAQSLAETLGSRGLDAEVMLTHNPGSDDLEHYVVVSTRPYASMARARRACRVLARPGIDCFARTWLSHTY